MVYWLPVKLVKPCKCLLAQPWLLIVNIINRQTQLLHASIIILIFLVVWILLHINVNVLISLAFSIRYNLIRLIPIRLILIWFVPNQRWSKEGIHCFTLWLVDSMRSPKLLLVFKWSGFRLSAVLQVLVISNFNYIL